MRDRHAVRGAHTTEAPALHSTGKAFTLGVASDVHQLSIHKVIGRKGCTDRQQAVGIVNAEFGNTSLGLNLCLGKFAALRFVHIFRFTGSGTEANGKITVLLVVAGTNHLAAFQRQYGHGYVTAIFLEEAHHTHLFRDHASTHDPYS